MSDYEVFNVHKVMHEKQKAFNAFVVLWFIE